LGNPALVTFSDAPSFSVSLLKESQILSWASGDPIQFDAGPTSLPPNLIGCDFGNSIVFCTRKSSQFSMVDKKTAAVETFPIGNAEIAVVCGAPGLAIIALKNAQILVYGHAESGLIRTYMCSVTCIAVNPLFDLIVAGNKSGTMLLCSLSKRIAQSAFELNDRRPLLVQITPTWGIIAVVALDKYSSKFFLCSHTLDGELIAESQLNQGFDFMTTFSSTNGLDYLAATDSTGSVFVIDPLRPTVGEPVYKSGSQILGLAFDDKARKIVLVNTAGEIIMMQKHW
jgi:hypothetical protein